MVNQTIVEKQYHNFEAFLKDIKIMVVMIHHAHLDQSIAAVQNKVILDTRNCALSWPESNRVIYL